MPPHFRQPLALPGCDKKLLRWPGPFGFGFLSPQPPGIVGIGPIAGSKCERHRVSVIEGQRELVLFVFGSLFFNFGCCAAAFSAAEVSLKAARRDERSSRQM